jgi:hypothetical protein
MRLTFFLSSWLALSIPAGCAAGSGDESPSNGSELRITATDAGFESPDSVSAGLVHVYFENHGTTMHEGMFIRLPDTMNAETYLNEVRGGT